MTVCFLPFRGEFGWYLMAHVKRIHSFGNVDKIVCVKRGHECLFPSATDFFYDWRDISDTMKAGVSYLSDEDEIKDRVITKFPNKEIHFVSSKDINWDNKHSFANYTFIPQSKCNLGLKADIVITPRNRKIDAHRNWKAVNWQVVVDILKEENISVAVCGAMGSTFELENVAYKSYHYVDVDSDIELMNNAKLVVTQESGMQYLSFLCERPTFCIDHYHADFGADLHRNPKVFFKNPIHVWEDPAQLADEVISFLKENHDTSL